MSDSWWPQVWCGAWSFAFITSCQDATAPETSCLRFDHLSQGLSIVGYKFESSKKALGFYLFSLWLCWVFIAAWGPSPVVASGVYSLVAMPGLLTAVISLVVEHGPQACRLPQLQNTGPWVLGQSVVVAHRLSCSVACGIFLDQGSNPCPCFGWWVLYHWVTKETLEEVVKQCQYPNSSLTN